MSVQRIASRYASTLVEIAQEQAQLDKVHEDVLTIKGAMEQSRELQLLMESPIIHGSKKFKALEAIFTGKITDLSLKFLAIVCKKGREPLMEAILDAFREAYKELKGVTEVEVTTASAVDEKVMEQIRTKIASLPGTRKNIEISHKIDESLVGGFIVQYDDKVYNASVVHHLETLRRQIAG